MTRSNGFEGVARRAEGDMGFELAIVDAHVCVRAAAIKQVRAM